MPSQVSNNSTSSQQSTDDLSFEEALASLQEVVSRLESGSLTLEDSIVTFRHGSELASRCQRMIAEAELRITELADVPGPEPVAPPVSTGTLF